MAEKEYPWFSFWVADWLSSETVTLMSLAGRGAYIHLLCRQWKADDCSIPDDEIQLARLLNVTPIEFKVIWAELAVCFPVSEPGRRQNQRLKAELERKGGRTKAATNNAKTRWDKADKQDEVKPPKRQAKPKSTAEEKPVGVDTPFAKVERILTRVSEELQGSPVQRADVVKQIRDNSPIRLLLEIMPEDQVVDLYLHAVKNWRAGASWQAVHAQRDALIHSMRNPGRKSGKETTDDKFKRLSLEEGGAA